jgi:Na+-driven multidrug efflux pump
MLMFALFPYGITQGFIPIAGYNHGAQNYERVRKVSKFLSNMQLAASLILFYTLLCNAYCIRFTTDPKVADTGCLVGCILQPYYPIIELPIFRRRKC